MRIFRQFPLSLCKYFAVNRTLAPIIVSITILLVSSCSRGYVTLHGYAQGGTYTVKYNSKGISKSPAGIQEFIDSILTDIDFSLSGYNRASILSRRNAGEDVEPDIHFKKVLGLSEHYREISGGAFDAAAAPLFDIWGFGFTSDSLPSPERIDAALQECREGRKLNFNAVAQGYSCDTVASYLRSEGIRDFLVDIGEIRCEGLNGRGQGWSIGIDTPEDGNLSPGASLSGIWNSDGGSSGVVTSGNYRKYYIKDGLKYAHTIDPRTGFPVRHQLLSATVIAPTAADADAIATWLMVEGPDGAENIVGSLPGVEACLISGDGEIWTSTGFKLQTITK